MKTNKAKPVELIENENLQHFPQTCSYDLGTLIGDLLNFAVKHLTIGGRLVFWMPFYRADYKESLLPKHESLKLLANSEQVLSTYVCRRLLTYEKIAEPESVLSENPSSSYEFDFRERYFKPTELSRKERRQQKFEADIAKRPDILAKLTAGGGSAGGDNL